MSRVCAYLLVSLALGLSDDANGEQANNNEFSDTEISDIELLEFLGSLDDSEAEWQEFFGSMSEQLDAEVESDAK